MVQCSVQWQGFLQLLGREWLAAAEPQALRVQMRARGRAWALHQALPVVTGLLELEQAMNDVWCRQQGGWVRLFETPQALVLRHGASPLADAFGAGSAAWVVGWLEGVYQTWLEAAGASPGSQIVGRPDAADPARFELLFTSQE